MVLVVVIELLFLAGGKRWAGKDVCWGGHSSLSELRAQTSLKSGHGPWLVPTISSSGSSSKAHMPSARRDSRSDKIAREASLGHAKATRVAICELRRVARFFAAIACACLLSAQSQDSPLVLRPRASTMRVLPGTYTTTSRLQTLTGVESPPPRGHRAAAVNTYMSMALGVAPP